MEGKIKLPKINEDGIYSLTAKQPMGRQGPGSIAWPETPVFVIQKWVSDDHSLQMRDLLGASMDSKTAARGIEMKREKRKRNEEKGEKKTENKDGGGNGEVERKKEKGGTDGEKCGRGE